MNPDIMSKIEPHVVAYDLRPFLSGDWDQLTAQHWGVLAGILTYTVTVCVVVVLLLVGGTCTRLREQAIDYEVKGEAAFKAPYQRWSPIPYSTHVLRRDSLSRISGSFVRQPLDLPPSRNRVKNYELHDHFAHVGFPFTTNY